MSPGWQQKPLSIWYNGGPGAPSTYGLFQEFGPFLLTSESFDDEYKRTGIPSPVYNPWTWVNVTSICEIDSPAPMGASFCTEGNGSATSKGGPSGDPYTCGPWRDTTTAAANHQAHIAFFRDAFPEFVTNFNPVSLIGESYAGVYVPLFVNAWLDDPVPGVNFHGFAVGDGFPACIPTPGRKVDWCADLNNVEFFKYPNAMPGPWWDVHFFRGHAQFSEALYTEIMSTCSEDELKGVTQPLGQACTLLMEKMAKEVGYFYVYNLFESCPGAVSASASRRRMLSPQRGRSVMQQVPLTPSPGDGDGGLGSPCLSTSMETYFGLNETLTAFGIPLDNNFIVLDNGIGFNYTTDSEFVGFVYQKAVKAGKRVLIYEGDSDASGLQTAPIEDIFVPFLGNGSGVWTPAGRLKSGAGTASPLNLPMTQSWRPWGVSPAGRKVQGGYVMEWAGGQVQFASIRGAGHLAPLYRPAASFTLMSAFQKGESLPPPITA